MLGSDEAAPNPTESTMRTHTPTKTAKTTTKPTITAVDYFTAKLTYEITPWTLKKNLLDDKTDTHFVIDVRGPEKYAESHIPGATNVPLADLVTKLKTLPKNKTIVTYCSNLTCSLAPKAALELAQKGFAVQHLVGGLQEWQQHGFPVER
jgi:rhodanese-related sulfurtransferase